MTSRELPFDNLYNTRDLGGMKTADGRRIRSGRLFRSGNLSQGSPKDIAWLKDNTSLVIDFRTSDERSEKPDPKELELVYLPILDEEKAGITRGGKSESEALQFLREHPAAARDHMTSMYRDFILTEYPLLRYRRFLEILLEDHERAVLWHCTAGKDRAGFAAIIIQEALGVDRADIREDYLKTNVCLRPETERMILHAKDEDEKEGIGYMFGAKEEYFDALYEVIEERYGDADSFLSQGLGLTDKERERLKEMYLE